jgi:hypothetical protein
MKLFFKRLINHWPTKLPQGFPQFEEWATDILSAYNMPDNDSTRFALAVCILHLPSTAAFKPKAFFGHTLIKGAASQVAGAMMQDLKNKQKAEQEAAQAAVLAAQVASTLTSIAEATTTAPAIVADAKKET